MASSVQLWKRSSDRVLTYIKDFVQLARPDSHHELLRLFDQTHRIFPHWVIMTCPVMHKNLYYISGNCEPVLGHNADFFLSSNRLESFFTHVHDADQADLQACFDMVHHYLEQVPPEEHQNYRMLMHYRFRRADGRYSYLVDEKGTFTMEDTGNLYFALMRDVTDEKVFKGAKVEVFHKTDALVKVDEFCPGSGRNKLSKRESELIALIKQGMSTKEIAWNLNISHHTVRNIKSKLFEKYQVNNTVELLNFAV